MENFEDVFGIIIFIVIFIFILITTFSGKKSGGKNGEKKQSDKPKYDSERNFSYSNDGEDERSQAIHANCNHKKEAKPYLELEDTYEMSWDEFKSLTLELLLRDYPSAKFSPYKYRGSPDIQLEYHGKQVDVRLMFVRENVAVDDSDFKVAIQDTDDDGSIENWFITNGKFSFTQRAKSGRVKLLDWADLDTLIRRHNIPMK